MIAHARIVQSHRGQVTGSISSADVINERHPRSQRPWHEPDPYVALLPRARPRDAVTLEIVLRPRPRLAAATTLEMHEAPVSPS
jgi:hypothetical protein